ncbi:hypothetical protein L7F22_049509 [Adiantum nelumboides]|nr:hypothetical protein [Adiantum nelumboides]MCO5595466.1 hypothetical protein [Adiantum nelumboides]
MKGLNISTIETVGKVLDPNVQEAIMREESFDYVEGVVIKEFRQGLMLGDKLLHPIMVEVSAGPPSSHASETAGSETAIEPAEEASK